MIYGLFFTTLTIYKVIALWRENPGASTTGLIRILMKDHLIYFFACDYIFMKYCAF